MSNNDCSHLARPDLWFAVTSLKCPGTHRLVDAKLLATIDDVDQGLDV